MKPQGRNVRLNHCLFPCYRKRGSASYIVREVRSVREREREREREIKRENDVKEANLLISQRKSPVVTLHVVVFECGRFVNRWSVSVNLVSGTSLKSAESCATSSWSWQNISEKRFSSIFFKNWLAGEEIFGQFPAQMQVTKPWCLQEVSHQGMKFISSQWVSWCLKLHKVKAFAWGWYIYYWDLRPSQLETELTGEVLVWIRKSQCRTVTLSLMNNSKGLYGISKTTCWIVHRITECSECLSC